MKITSEIMQAEIDQKLPPYYTTSNPRLVPITNSDPPGYDGLWFSMCFRYPGSGDKYVWVSVKEEMTAEEIDKWSTDAVIQIKLTQQIGEFEAEADRLDKLHHTG